MFLLATLLCSPSDLVVSPAVPLTIYLVFSVAMTSYLVIGPASWTNSIMQFMTDISTEHRLIVMGVVLGNLLATLVFEWLIAPLSCWKVLLSCCKLPSCTRITQSLCCCVCRRASSSSEEREVDMTMLPPTSSTDLDWLQLMSDAALSGKSNRGGGKFVGTPPSPQLTTTRPRSPLSAAVVGLCVVELPSLPVQVVCRGATHPTIQVDGWMRKGIGWGRGGSVGEVSTIQV